MLTAVVSFILITVLTHGCKRTPFGREGAGHRDKQRISSIAPLSPYGFPLPIFFPVSLSPRVNCAFEHCSFGHGDKAGKALFRLKAV